jgi:polar amino acid transport system substrate-binding protein
MELKETMLFTYPTTQHALKALLNEEIDAIVIDRHIADWAIQQYNQLQAHLLKDSAEYYAICVQKGNTKLLNEINAILDEMLANGEIEELVKKHSTVF